LITLVVASIACVSQEKWLGGR